MIRGGIGGRMKARGGKWLSVLFVACLLAEAEFGGAARVTNVVNDQKTTMGEKMRSFWSSMSGVEETSEQMLHSEKYPLTGDNYTNSQLVKEQMPWILAGGLALAVRTMYHYMSVFAVHECTLNKLPEGMSWLPLEFDLSEMMQGVWPSVHKSTRVIVSLRENGELIVRPYNKYSRRDTEYTDQFLAVMTHEFDFHAGGTLGDTAIVIAVDCITLNNHAIEGTKYESIMTDPDGLTNYLSTIEDDGRTFTSTPWKSAAKVTLDVISSSEGYKFCPRVDVDIDGNEHAYLRLEETSRECYDRPETEIGSTAGQGNENAIAVAKKREQKYNAILDSYNDYHRVLREITKHAIDTHRSQKKKMWFSTVLAQPHFTNVLGVHEMETTSFLKVVHVAVTVIVLLFFSFLPYYQIRMNPDGASNWRFFGTFRSWQLLIHLISPAFVSVVFYLIGKYLLRARGHKLTIVNGHSEDDTDENAGQYIVHSTGDMMANTTNTTIEKSHSDDYHYFSTSYTMAMIAFIVVLQLSLYYSALAMKSEHEFQSLRNVEFVASWLGHMLTMLFYSNAISQIGNEYLVGTPYQLPNILAGSSETLVLALQEAIGATSGFINEVQTFHGHANLFCDLRELHELVITSPSFERNPNSTITLSCPKPNTCNTSDHRPVLCPWGEIPQQHTRVLVEDQLCSLFCVSSTGPGGAPKLYTTGVGCEDDGIRGGGWQWHDILGENICDEWQPSFGLPEENMANPTDEVKSSIKKDTGGN